MSTIIHAIEGTQQRRGTKTLLAGLAQRFSGLSERFWFLVAFLLFVVMGPFAIFAVIAGLFSLANDESNKEASEPASL